MFERKEVFVGVPSKRGRLGKASFSGSETLQCASAVGRGGRFTSDGPHAFTHSQTVGQHTAAQVYSDGSKLHILLFSKLIFCSY